MAAYVLVSHSFGLGAIRKWYQSTKVQNHPEALPFSSVSNAESLLWLKLQV